MKIHRWFFFSKIHRSYKTSKRKKEMLETFFLFNDGQLSIQNCQCRKMTWKFFLQVPWHKFCKKENLEVPSLCLCPARSLRVGAMCTSVACPLKIHPKKKTTLLAWANKSCTYCGFHVPFWSRLLLRKISINLEHFQLGNFIYEM